MNDSIQYYIRDIIKSIPYLVEENIPNVYRNDKLLCHNLYVSSLLSLLSRFTLSKRYRDYMQKKLDSCISFDEVKYYKKHLDNDAIILWKLPDNMAPIVNLILNKVKAQLVEDIKEVSNDFKVTEAMFQDMSKDLIFGDTGSEDW